MGRRNRRHQKRRNESGEGFAPTSNPEQAHWMRELGKSNAAQRHVPTPRKGSRRERERQAIRDQQRNSREG
jgi:hypothetical protein